ncbi:hypothetical protein BDZ45DRAFT_36392 [Acephala macrosclerotiorum]|nr:hypothetical protein BDZ45DRAFT_36392 [Acephala macrosclerotiorum]
MKVMKSLLASFAGLYMSSMVPSSANVYESWVRFGARMRCVAVRVGASAFGVGAEPMRPIMDLKSVVPEGNFRLVRDLIWD